MDFLISANIDDLASGKAYSAYQAYLKGVKPFLPDSVYQFATAEWHYNFHDPRSPHDSWVIEARVSENATGQRKEVRNTSLEIITLGAYHDRILKFSYQNVVRYCFNNSSTVSGHGDWLIDEICLSEQKLVIHKIKFSSGSQWEIECGNMTHTSSLISTS